MNRAEIATTLRTILSQQLFGILATQAEAGPHTTIVAFASADDLETIVFATQRETRKYSNLRRETRVSLFIDDRKNNYAALGEIMGIEIRGNAQELQKGEREPYELIYNAKHPPLAEFGRNAALVRIHVERYDLVQQFQNVLVLEMNAGQEEGL